MSKSIVVYYSWAGHTRSMAKIIAHQTGADILEIKPVAPYSTNYNTVTEQAKREITAGVQVPIQPIECDINAYDTLFLGSPIWWGTIAPPLATFLTENELSGKTVIPFTTHGGGGKSRSERDIARLCPLSELKPMLSVYEGGNAGEVAKWVEQAGF